MPRYRIFRRIIDPFTLRNLLVPGSYKPVANGLFTATAGYLADPRIQMSTYNGNISMSAGQVLENTIVNGVVTVNVADCIIRNCIIQGSPTDPGGTSGNAMIRAHGAGCENLLIHDTTLAPTHSNYGWDGIQGHDFTARRVHIKHTTDGIGIFNTSAPAAAANVAITGCVIENLAKFFPDGGAHSDGTHNDCIQIQSGNGGITIRGNVLSCHLAADRGNTSGTNTVVGGGQYSPVNHQGNAVLQVNNNLSGGVTAGIVLDKNWLYGGNIAVNITDAAIAAGTDIGSFTDNRFDHGQYYDVAQQGSNTTQTLRINGNLTALISGNTYEDNSAAVLVRRP